MLSQWLLAVLLRILLVEYFWQAKFQINFKFRLNKWPTLKRVFNVLSTMIKRHILNIAQFTYVYLTWAYRTFQMIRTNLANKIRTNLVNKTMFIFSAPSLIIIEIFLKETLTYLRDLSLLSFLILSWFCPNSQILIKVPPAHSFETEYI